MWLWWNSSILSYSWRQSQVVRLDTQSWMMTGAFPLLFFMSHSREASVYYCGLLSVSGLLLRVSSYSLVKLLTIRRGHVLEVRALRPALIIKLKKEFTLHSWPTDFCIREDPFIPWQQLLVRDIKTWFWDGRDCTQAMVEAQVLLITSVVLQSNLHYKHNMSGSLQIFQFHFILTMHSDGCGCFCNALNILGYTLVQTLVILLHPVDD